MKRRPASPGATPAAQGPKHAPIAPDQRQHPAACISLKGRFVEQNKDALRDLVVGLSKQASATHAAHQLLELLESEGALLITTSSAHLARQIGEALESAFLGKTEYSFSETDRLLCVDWQRD